MKTLTKKFWQYVEKNKHEQLCNKVYNWLDEDNLSDIILDGNTFWIELTCPATNTIPDYIYSFIIKWATELGYTHLFQELPLTKNKT